VLVGHLVGIAADLLQLLLLGLALLVAARHVVAQPPAVLDAGLARLQFFGCSGWPFGCLLVGLCAF